MKRFLSKRFLTVLTVGTTLLLFAESAFAQVTILRPRQGVNYTTTWVGTNRHLHLEAQFMYGGDTPDAWRELFMSGNVLGFSGQRLTRGIDISEDWDYNFKNPAKYNPDATGNQTYYYGEFENASATQSTTYQWATKFTSGPRAGQSLFNEDIIAVGGDALILYNHNNTISRYGMNGALQADYSWTTFTGGAFDGMLLGDMLKYMIGYEEDGTPALYFIDDDNILYTYNIADGTIVSTFDFVFGDDAKAYLGDARLVDIIDGKVEGWSYIGWDVGPILINIDGIVIPEPGAYAAAAGLIALMLAFGKRRYRRF
jgi:hypothetical protein